MFVLSSVMDKYYSPVECLLDLCKIPRRKSTKAKEESTTCYIRYIFLKYNKAWSDIEILNAWETSSCFVITF